MTKNSNTFIKEILCKKLVLFFTLILMGNGSLAHAKEIIGKQKTTPPTQMIVFSGHQKALAETGHALSEQETLEIQAVIDETKSSQPKVAAFHSTTTVSDDSSISAATLASHSQKYQAFVKLVYDARMGETDLSRSNKINLAFYSVASSYTYLVDADCFDHEDLSEDGFGMTQCWVEGLDPEVDFGTLHLYAYPQGALVLKFDSYDVDYYDQDGSFLASTGTVEVENLRREGSYCYRENSESYDIDIFNEENLASDCEAFSDALVMDVGVTLSHGMSNPQGSF